MRCCTTKRKNKYLQVSLANNERTVTKEQWSPFCHTYVHVRVYVYAQILQKFLSSIHRTERPVKLQFGWNRKAVVSLARLAICYNVFPRLSSLQFTVFRSQKGKSLWSLNNKTNKIAPFSIIRTFFFLLLFLFFFFWFFS